MTFSSTALVLVLLATLLTSKAIAYAAQSSKECSTAKTVELSNGVQLPLVSLGSSHLLANGTPSNPNFVGMVPERAYQSIQFGLESGIRSIDTALIYRCHTMIRAVLGEWFRAGTLKRDDIFLQSKVFHGPADGFGTINSHMLHLEDMSPEEVAAETKRQVERTLEELGVGYLDLLLMHWPAPFESQNPQNRFKRIAAWRVFEEYYKMGWVRAIGVSNYSEKHLEQLREDGATVVPMVNQIEASVYVQWNAIMEYCKKHNIALQSYSSLGAGRMNLFDDTVVNEVAKKHEKSAAQVALRFLIQQGYAVVFLSTSLDRITANQEIFDFELDADDMTKLVALNRHAEGTWGLPSPYSMT